MKKHLLRVAAISAAVALNACATTSTDPEVVCTSEWVSKRADAAMSEFSKDVKPALRVLKNAASDFESGKNIGALRQLRVMNALQGTVKKFEKSKAIKDVKLLSETCNDPQLIARSMRGFLEDQGASPQIIDFLESLPQFQEMVAEQAAK